MENVLDAAKAKGLRTGENPARWRGHLNQLLPKRQRLARGHHAALAYDLIPDFMANLRTRSAVAARALEFAILTASRSGEVLGATWNEIDLDKKVLGHTGDAHEGRKGTPRAAIGSRNGDCRSAA